MVGAHRAAFAQANRIPNRAGAKKSGQAQADERATLYGLVVYSGRAVSYARINPTEAREIFIPRRRGAA